MNRSSTTRSWVMQATAWTLWLLIALPLQAADVDIFNALKSIPATPASIQKGGAMPKATLNLESIYDEYKTFVNKGGNLTSFRSTQIPAGQVSRGFVTIDAVAEGDAEVLRADLEALGLQDAAVAGRMVSGRLPVDAIPAMAKLPSLRYARPAMFYLNAVTPEPGQGAVVSEGDKAQTSDRARDRYGVNGNEVAVGVLSDSFDCLGGANADVQSGDLPAQGVVVLREFPDCTQGTDEGRAMLQIIHDVAPKAQLGFHTSAGGEASLANGIQALAAAGAHIIVDDVRYFSEPVFQDGVIAQSVNDVVSKGVVYFSSAGNQARDAYLHEFVDSETLEEGYFPPLGDGAPQFWGGVAHDFTGNGNYLQRITVEPGGSMIIFLQWDDPFYSVSGPPGAANDLDMYVLYQDQVVMASAEINTGGDPLEAIGLHLPDDFPQALDLDLLIVRYSGSPGEVIEYQVYKNHLVSFANPGLNGPTLYGHPNAGGAIAVAAAPWNKTPAFGTNPPELEPFSSAGGMPLFFDPAGNRLDRPVVWAKPEFTAPDGGNTTFFGQDVDGDGHLNFFGTSAAAPHAAGVAALMLDVDANLSPDAIRAALQQSAIDIVKRAGSGQPVGDGFDLESGAGLIQADRAMGSPPPPPPPSGHLTVGPGEPIRSAASKANGQVAITTCNADHKAIVMVDHDNHNSCNGAVIDNLSPSGATDVWFDPKDNSLNVAVPSQSGLMLKTLVPGRGELETNLTALIGGNATPIVTKLTHFVTPPGTDPAFPMAEKDRNNVHIIGMDGNGDLVDYYQARSRDGGATSWTFKNITRADFGNTPDWASNLVGYSTPWNGWSIAGLNRQGELIVAWTAPDKGFVWYLNNFSKDYEVPPLDVSAGLAVYVNWGINIAGVTPNGHMQITWWSAQHQREVEQQGSRKIWAFNDITQEKSGPLLKPKGLAGCTVETGNGADTSVHVIALKQSGGLVDYWWTPPGGVLHNQWMVDDNLNRASGSESPVRALSAACGNDLRVSALGAADNGDVLRYLRLPDRSWKFENLTEMIEGHR